MRRILLTTTAAALLALAYPAFAFDAVIAECHDADTCRLTDGTRVRLHGVDAPELDQPYGNEAAAFTRSLVVGQRVDVQPTGDLSYGRTVADIVVNGRNVGAELVAHGWAWSEARWNTDPLQPGRQAAAQAAHLGLWADAAAVPPWVWRHGGAGHAYTPHYSAPQFSGGWRSR